MKLKNLLYIALCICIASVMSACSGPSEGKTPGEPTPGITSGTTLPLQYEEVTIYSIDSVSLEKVAITVLMNEVTPELIVEQVVSAMKDDAFYVEVNDVILKDDAVIVDFKADAPPVVGVGAGVEGAILDAIGQSILDNLSEYSKIIYRIEGGAYETGHFELGIDEVYIGR